ncbi:MAG: glycosyl hydrolase family 28 protein [Chloroflexota bacterium]
MNNTTRIDASQFPGKNGGERIQAAIDSLGEKPNQIEVGHQGPDQDGGWILTKAIIIPSNTTLVFHNSRLFMADNISDNMIRNFHADSGDDRRDENIHILGIGGAELNGNAEHQVRQGQVYKNFGIAFHKVDKASIKGIALGPTEAWGMGLENVNDLFVDGIRFQQDGKTHNQDGIHVCGPGSRICISNIIGTVADDAIAIDAGAGAEDYRGSARGPGGFLENIVVSNVSVKNLRSGSVVRTVAAKGKGLDEVFISQVMITDANQVLKIGWDRWGARQARHEIGDVFPACEEQQNIVIDGVKGTTDDVFCRIESNVKNLTIRNVRGKCGAAAFTNISPDGDCFSMENVLLEDWMIEGCKSGIEIGGDVLCSNFTVKNSAFSAMTDSDGIGIRLSGAGKILNLQRLLFDNVNFNGFSKGLKVDKDVQIEDALRIVNSDFNGAINELDISDEKVKME